MKLRLTLLAAALLTGLAACREAPPIVVMIVTATPAVPSALESTVITASPTATLTATLAPLETTPLPPTDAAVVPTNTPAGPPTRTPLPPAFPTPVRAQIQVAEQLYEGGRMFWVQPTQEIWVLIVTAEGRGEWLVYPDTYVEGEPESDPNITPPEGRFQPERGFGKLWREAPNLRERLGWAVTPEFGYVSNYEYHAGGSVDANGVYTAGPGYHVLYSLYSEQFRFNEIDGTWQLGGG